MKKKISINKKIVISAFLGGLCLGFVWGLNGFLDFLDSNFFQTLVTVIIASLGLHYFFVQQRSLRIQKLYFDDVWLSQMKKADADFSRARQYASIFASVMDEVQNLMERTVVDKTSLIASIQNSINAIPEPATFNETTVEEIISFLIPDERGDHITQWFQKFDADIGVFFSIIKGQLVLLRNELNTNDSKRDKLKDNEMLRTMLKNVTRRLWLLERHKIMMHYFCSLVRLYAQLKYSNQEELASAYKDPNFSKIISILDVSFKRLFCFYKIDENTFFSFTEDEDGKNFKITIKSEYKAMVQREVLSEEKKKNLKVIFNDAAIADSVIDDTKNSFAEALIGITNWNNFKLTRSADIIPHAGFVEGF